MRIDLKIRTGHYLVRRIAWLPWRLNGKLVWLSWVWERRSRSTPDSRSFGWGAWSSREEVPEEARRLDEVTTLWPNWLELFVMTYLTISTWGIISTL